MNKPASTVVYDGLYDRLLDERLSAEVTSLIQANKASIEALPAEERSARLAEAFVKILVGTLGGVEPDEAGTPREQAQMAVIAELLGLLRKDYRASELAEVAQCAAVDTSTVSAVRCVRDGACSRGFSPRGARIRRCLPICARSLTWRTRWRSSVEFIKWSGVRKRMDRFETGGVTDAAGVPRRRVRILTTTYMGATQARAVLALPSFRALR